MAAFVTVSLSIRKMEAVNPAQKHSPGNIKGSLKKTEKLLSIFLSLGVFWWLEGKKVVFTTANRFA